MSLDYLKKKNSFERDANITFQDEGHIYTITDNKCNNKCNNKSIFTKKSFRTNISAHNKDHKYIKIPFILFYYKRLLI